MYSHSHVHCNQGTRRRDRTCICLLLPLKILKKSSCIHLTVAGGIIAEIEMRNTVLVVAALSLLAFAAVEVSAQAQAPLGDYDGGIIIGAEDYFDYAGDYNTLVPGMAPMASVPEPSADYDVPADAPEPEAQVPTGEVPIPVEIPIPSIMPSPMPAPPPSPSPEPMPMPSPSPAPAPASGATDMKMHHIISAMAALI